MKGKYTLYLITLFAWICFIWYSLSYKQDIIDAINYSLYTPKGDIVPVEKFSYDVTIAPFIVLFLIAVLLGVLSIFVSREIKK